MGEITINQIFEWAVWLSSGIGTIIGLGKLAGGFLRKLLQNELAPLNTKLSELSHKLDTADRERAKNYIVRFLTDVEQGEPVDQDELHCFWDNYAIYQALGGNTYVHDKVEKLKKAGKL